MSCGSQKIACGGGRDGGARRGQQYPFRSTGPKGENYNSLDQQDRGKVNSQTYHLAMLDQHS